MTYSGIKFDSKCRGKKEEIDKRENERYMFPSSPFV